MKLSTDRRSIITKEVIDAHETPKGGWKREVLNAWGVPWPPPKGWKARLLEYGVPYKER